MHYLRNQVFGNPAIVRAALFRPRYRAVRGLANLETPARAPPRPTKRFRTLIAFSACCWIAYCFGTIAGTKENLSRVQNKHRPNYQPLVAPDEIRLLVLEPGDVADPVVCRLKRARLDQKPAFEALSYVWGDKYHIKYIECEGTKVQVTQNLYQALRHLRFPDRERFLWVDALCMNQGDNVEKSSHIPLMSRIYSQAQQTVVWLGVSTQDSKRAFAALGEIDNFLCRNSKPYKDGKLLEQVHPSNIWSSRHGIAGLSNSHAEELRKFDWESVTALASNDWFGRVWTYQEFVLSSQAILVAGHDALPIWKFLNPLIANFLDNQDDNIVSQPEQVRESDIGLRNIIHMAMHSSHAHNSDTTTLLNLVVATASRGATESRDRIFAYLNLASDWSELDWEVRPDYKAKEREIFRRFARWCLVRRNNLNYLSHVSDHLTPGPGPSWVVPWKQNKYLDKWPSEVGCFHAASALKPCITWNAKEPRILNVEGRIVDTVEDLAASYDDIKKYNDLEIVNITRKALWASRMFLVRLDNLWGSKSRVLVERLREGGETIERFTTEDMPLHLRGYIAWIEACRDIAFKGANRVIPIRYEERFEEFWRTMLRDCMLTSFDQFQRTEFRQAFLKYIASLSEMDDTAWHRVDSPKEQQLQNIMFGAFSGIRKKRFCSTSNGRLGWAHINAQRGDIICAFDGANVLHILRTKADKYHLVGECYIQGLMRGEIEDLKDVERKVFQIC